VIIEGQVFLLLNGTDASGTNSGDNVLLEDGTKIKIGSGGAGSENMGFGRITEANTGAGVIIEDGLISGMDNKIINGNFAVNQRSDDQSETASYTAASTPANSDDTYLFDRWKLLSDGNDIVDVHSYGRTMGSRDFGGNSAPAWMPSETSFAMAMDVETANTKFGQAQFIESMNCNDLRGRSCTLSWKARVRTTQTSTSIKAAVIGWFGTSDTITSDIISAWNDEGTNPTLVANAEYLNEPSNILLNSTMQTYTINVSVPDGIKNVIVFIWNDMSNGDVGTTVGDFIFLSDVQLERGEFENPRFQNETYDITERKCHRYYYKAIGTHYGQAYSSSSGFVNTRMSHPMRVAPTVVRYSNIRTTTGLTYYNNRARSQVLMTSGIPYISNLEVDAEL